MNTGPGGWRRPGPVLCGHSVRQRDELGVVAGRQAEPAVLPVAGPPGLLRGLDPLARPCADRLALGLAFNQQLHAPGQHRDLGALAGHDVGQIVDSALKVRPSTTCPELRAKEKRQQKYIRGRIIFGPVFLSEKEIENCLKKGVEIRFYRRLKPEQNLKFQIPNTNYFN